MNADAIHFLTLYRTPEGWRISFGGPEGIACGALDDIPADTPIETAAQAFSDMLNRNFGLDLPITWQQTSPDQWGADLPHA